MDAKFYVPYETAQLLKEKGYEAETDYYYNKETKSITSLRDLKNEWYPDSLQKVIDARYIPAPTYHEVLDWLEHTHHISVWASYIKQRWYGVVCRNDIRDADNTYPGDFYTSREEALNVAILETLKRI